MRIYFVGAHSVGKTSLARYISQRFRIAMLGEIARVVAAEMEVTPARLASDLDVRAAYQKRVFHRQISVERRSGDEFIADRAFDNLAYAAEFSLIGAQLLESVEYAEYMTWVSQGLIFFIRPQRQLLPAEYLGNEGYWEGVLRLDGMIKFMLEQHRMVYIPIESSSMQERVRLVQGVLVAHDRSFSTPTLTCDSVRTPKTKP